LLLFVLELLEAVKMPTYFMHAIDDAIHF